MGQDPAVSLYAGRLLKYQLPGIYMQAIDEALALFFTALEKNYIMLIIDSFRIPLHLGLLYLFMVKFDLELLGCAMAVNLVYFFKFLMTKVIVDYYKKTLVDLRESFFIRIDSDTFDEYRAFLKLATAGLLLSCLEWWIGEAMTLMGGYIDVDSQAAQVIVNTIAMMMSYLTLSFSYTMSAMIGSALGEGNVKQAKNVAI